MEICNCLECVELGRNTHRSEETPNPREEETQSDAK